MDPKFQTSFIPKKPISTSITKTISIESSSNLISSLATALFVLTLVVWGGLYGYDKFLQYQIAKADQDLTAAKGAFDVGTINKLIATNSRIQLAGQLLDGHLQLSQLFYLFQSLLVKKVRFSNLTYTRTVTGYRITADVEAQSYNILASQADIFQKSSFIGNAQFSDFDLNDNGNVVAKMAADVAPDLLSYKKNIESKTQTVTSITPAVSTSTANIATTTP